MPKLIPRNVTLWSRCSSRAVAKLIRPVQTSRRRAESVTLPTLEPQSSSSNHWSLESFLDHARRNALSPTTTVFKGTLYEYLCQKSLTQLGLMNLVRVGGRDDAGIDLVGVWKIPSVPAFRVLVQCKALKLKAGPNLVRELEGMFAGAPGGYHEKDTLAMLCSTRPATNGVREAIRNCRKPVMWIQIAKESIKPGRSEEMRMKQMLWNTEAAKIGLQGYVVVTRHDADGGSEVMLEGRGETQNASTRSRTPVLVPVIDDDPAAA